MSLLRVVAAATAVLPLLLGCLYDPDQPCGAGMELAENGECVCRCSELDASVQPLTIDGFSFEDANYPLRSK